MHNILKHKNDCLLSSRKLHVMLDHDHIHVKRLKSQLNLGCHSLSTMYCNDYIHPLKKKDKLALGQINVSWDYPIISNLVMLLP